MGRKHGSGGGMGISRDVRSFDLQAQGQALRTNYIKFYIDKTSESPMSRMCGDKGESVSHLTSAAG